MCDDCGNKEHKETKSRGKISLAKAYPKLLEEWNYEKNNKLGIKPENVAVCSNKKVFWTCKVCKKVWEATIQNRSKLNRGCHFCTSYKPCEANNLENKFPKIAAEWNYKENKNLTPKDITAHSNKEVSWICPTCKESYKAKINSRTIKKTSCPFCTGQKVCNWNCLATNFPKIAAEWNYKENGNLTPHNVTKASNKNVSWICPNCNKTYKTRIVHRTIDKSNCPYCCGIKVCDWNCLKTLRPDLVEEWHPTKNEQLTPDKVTEHSGKKVWWLCKNGHEWHCAICSRTNLKSNCPKCIIFYHELICKEIMNDLFNKEFNKYRSDSLRNRRGKKLELDCFNEDLKINIEYDGRQHFQFIKNYHKDFNSFKRTQENDIDKDLWCKNNKILQIRVSYKYDTKDEIKNYIIEQLFLHNRLPT